MSRIAVWALVAVLSLAACTATSEPEPSPQPSAPAGADVLVEETPEQVASVADRYPRPLRLVTLGDAYTHGTETAAPRRDSWPAQLADSLGRSGINVVLRNLAEPSVSSDELLELQLPLVESLKPDVVTLQVGVNDIVSGQSAWYSDNIVVILDELLSILPSERILVITTPDHTLTEWGGLRGTAEVEQAAVRELNATLRDAARERDIEVVDIGPVNALAGSDPTLVVQGDPPVPYPSAKQYAGWAEVIGPYVRASLSTIEP